MYVEICTIYLTRISTLQTCFFFLRTNLIMTFSFWTKNLIMTLRFKISAGWSFISVLASWHIQGSNQEIGGVVFWREYYYVATMPGQHIIPSKTDRWDAHVWNGPKPSGIQFSWNSYYPSNICHLLLFGRFFLSAWIMGSLFTSC